MIVLVKKIIQFSSTENPILCMDELSRLFVSLESQETRLLGIAHCIVPKEELTIEPPIFVAPSIPRLPVNLLDVPIAGLSKVLMDAKPGIVQLIVPVVTETTTPTIATTTNAPITTTPVETTPRTIASEIIEIVTTEATTTPEIIVDHTESVIATTTSKENQTNVTAQLPSSSTDAKQPETLTPSNNEVNVDARNQEESVIVYTMTPTTNTPSAVTEIVVTTSRPIVMTTSTFSSIEPVLQAEISTMKASSIPIPTSTPTPIEVTTMPLSVAQIILRQPETISTAPEQDNYVYETYSTVPEVIGAIDDRAQQLVLVEEPPENLPNDAAPPPLPLAAAAAVAA